MTSVLSAPANGGTGVQNEHDDPEINAMALKMKDKYQKNASAPVKQTLVIVPTTSNNTQTNNQEQLHKDCEDVYSIKGRFSWKIIEGYYIPYIIRVINGEKLQFVSVRMAETQLLSKYLHYLHADMYTCTSVRSYFMTVSEASLLNYINNFHSDFAFGNAIFFARKDYIVLLEDVQEFYTFVDVCYKALLFNNNTGLKEKCGFIFVNFESVLPYSIKDGKQYIPLFCFEYQTENLQHLTVVKLENWNLAYLKFCCKLQGIINNEFYASDSCKVISLDDIKKSYSSDTHFVEYWPTKIIDTQLLTNQNSTHVNSPGVWIIAPLDVVIPENSTIPHTLTESAPLLPQSMPVIMNTYQNGWPANQMGSPLLQGSSLINGAVRVVSPPPLVHAGSTALVIGPVAPTIHDTIHSNFGWKLTKIPERIRGKNENTAAYKIHKAPLQGKMFHCINVKPYNYSELMVTLDDLVQMMLPSCTVLRCTHILQKFLKTTLFSGNFEQFAVLRENRCLRSIYPEDTPLAMLQDINHVLLQLKILMYMQDEEIQQYQSAGQPSKRHRTS